MLSSFLKQPVDVPFDADLYAEKLAELAETSAFQKVVVKHEVNDFGSSYSK